MRLDTKSPLRHRLTVMVPTSLISIAESVVSLATLTLYNPSWSFKYCAWSAIRSIERRRK